MRVLIASDARFTRDPQGCVWVANTSAYEAWARYLDVFDHVEVLARVAESATAPERFLRADGPGVSFVPMPHYHGPAGYLRRALTASSIATQAVQGAEAVLLRGPGQVAYDVHRSLETDRPFGVEVLGDPYDVFAPGAVKHPLRPWFRVWFTRQQKRVVRDASAVAYDTERYLQRRYPSAEPAFTIAYSEMGYPDEMFVDSPRQYDAIPEQIHAVTVGSLDQMYKGVDVLLKAMAECRGSGVNMTLSIVGEGRHRQELEDLARSLGIFDHVRFLGQLPSGDPVIQQLDSSDLFILPSRTEGLPRAVIEAMARGVPAIGTTVGGIPELLDAQDLVPAGDDHALAAKIREVVIDPGRLGTMSRRNMASARRYGVDEVRRRRNTLLVSLREQTQQWFTQERVG